MNREHDGTVRFDELSVMRTIQGCQQDSTMAMSYGDPHIYTFDGSWECDFLARTLIVV